MGQCGQDFKMIETEEFTMAESKEEAYFMERKAEAEKNIIGLEKNLETTKENLENIPRHIEFNKLLIELCNSKIKKK